MTSKNELIKRLEAATEGSRELDKEIAEAFGWVHECMNSDTHPHLTTSIDAALTLVPEGCSPSMISWRVESITEPTDRVKASVIGEDETKFPDGRHFSGSGATPL